MRNWALAAFLAAACAVAPGSSPRAEEYDLSQDTLPDPITINAGSDDSFLYRSAESLTPGNAGRDLSISDDYVLTIGQDASSGGMGFTLELGNINLGPGELNILSANAPSLADGCDVTVNAAHLELSTGAALSLDAAGAGTATLNIASLASTGAGVFSPTLTVGTNAAVNVLGTDPTTLSGIRITLDGGSLAFAGDAAFSGSSATVTVDSRGSLAVGGDAAFSDTARVDLDDGGTLSVKGVASLSTGASISLDNGSSVVAGGMRVESGASISGSGDSSIVLGNGRRGDLVLDGGEIRATNGALAIVNAAVLVTAGNAANTLSSETGSLDLSTSTLTVDLATPGDEARMAIGEDLTVRSYSQRSGIVGIGDAGGSGRFTVLDKSAIGLAGATDAVVFSTDGAKTVFQGGLVLLDQGVLHSSTGAGEIAFGGGSTAADLEMAGGATLHGGDAGAALTLSNAGTTAVQLLITGLDNRIVGDVDASGLDLVVNAGGDGTALTVTEGDNGGIFQARTVTVRNGSLVLGSGGDAGRLSVHGDLIVRSGGTLAVRDTDAAITGYAGLNRIRVEEGGILSAESANIIVNDFHSVVVDGLFQAGYDAGNTTLNDSGITGLITGADLAGGVVVNGAVGFTDEAALAVQVDDVLVDAKAASGDIVYNGSTVNTTIFGSYQLGLNNDRDQLVVKAIVNRIDGDNSSADRAKAYRNLSAVWGRQVDAALAGLLYDATVTSTLTAAPDSRAGETNLALFQAVANPTGRRVGTSTVEYLNGASLYGVTDVAVETSRAFFSGIATRARTVKSEFTDVRQIVDEYEIASDEALGSAILATCHTNRFWAGGFGLWQDADKRQGYSGYRYESWGMIMGLDRAVAEGLALGASFAYNKGDYADKGAYAHGSTIQSYTGGVYGVYSHESGVNATVFGSYASSDNDIRELRDNPAIGGRSWSEADYKTKTWAAGGLLAYDFKPTSRFTLTPSAGLHYIRARNDDHEERLGGVVTQRVRESRNHGVFLPVEVQAEYEFVVAGEGRLVAEAGVGYAYNFHGGSMDGVIDYFGLTGPGGAAPTAAVNTRDNAHHNYKAGLGARLNYKQYDIGIRYEYTGKGSYTAHRAVGSIGISF